MTRRTRTAPTGSPSPPDGDFGLGAQDLHFFNEGTHARLYRILGAHLEEGGGCRFAVWAPNAERVAAVGDFNDWDPGRDPLAPTGSSGIWAGRVGGVKSGARYKYQIESRVGAHRSEKADPLAFRSEEPPRTASVVWPLDYEWSDGAWMAERGRRNGLGAPISVYELHLGSWRRGDGNRMLSYRDLAGPLIDHVRDVGFTHVEFLPVMEHPFYGSWGYQTTGYFAPTARYGSPQDLMGLIDRLHQAEIGVLLDWVPSHFPNDAHGLAFFDGTHLYEHADPRLGYHPDWGSLIFNYGRNEVRSFLLSSAAFWLEQYHADGLRVDAVASMLYRDYSRKPGEWLPNVHGGRENLEAMAFLRLLNEFVYGAFPGVQTVAEESTAWPMVSRPTYLGGLGFGLKWDMGWMHDTLRYFSKDPVHRKHHHGELTFRMLYAFNENFMLPLSHDEVVHGKGSLLGRMPGDEWQKRANLRLLFGYMFGQPGKKLLFMGAEFAQEREWTHEASLDWHLLERPGHDGIRRWLRDLHRTYRAEPALHRADHDAAGFEWVDAEDGPQSVLAFLRKADGGAPPVLVACNFTPVPRHGYRVGVPEPGAWREVLNSDAATYGGSGVGNLGRVRSDARPAQGRPHSVSLTLPPLASVYFRWDGKGRDA